MSGPLRSAPRGPSVAEGTALGRLGEDLAAAHLAGLGFSIVARNVRTRWGEIDMIAFDGHTLVIAEVKSRRSRRPGGENVAPLHRLGVRQRARLRRLAAAWLHDRPRQHPFAETIRFDAIGVTVDRHGALLSLEHLEGAF